ncbi:hypothetical protein WJ05_06830 [Burkholderia vietnamiensis]|nr:hypothetical protein WJ05_06830 [Burkholderia vietnamiensis]
MLSKIAKMSATVASVSCGQCRDRGADGSALPTDHGHGPIECGASNHVANSVAVIDGITTGASVDSGGCGRGMI